MTPTPDPPPAGSPLGSTLTAEQIAAIRAYYNKMTSGLTSWELYDIPALIASHADLRDRLARAEAMLEDAHSTLYVLSQMAHNWANMGTAEEYKAMVDANVVRASRMRKRIHALLATPTDGAARAEARAVNLREARGLVAMAHDLAQQITYRANGDFREKAGRLELALVDAMSALSEASSDEGGAT